MLKLTVIGTEKAASKVLRDLEPVATSRSRQFDCDQADSRGIDSDSAKRALLACAEIPGAKLRSPFVLLKCTISLKLLLSAVMTVERLQADLRTAAGLLWRVAGAACT